MERDILTVEDACGGFASGSFSSLVSTAVDSDLTGFSHWPAIVQLAPGFQTISSNTLTLPPAAMAPSPPSVAIPRITAADFAGRSFDYLVVGGGTAGLVVAARLSEDPSLTVGVLEAGSVGVGDPAIDVPGLYGSTLGTQYDWRFETVPQPGLAGRSLPWPRGKVLGGTSALNFMTWNRPSRDDFDAWERLGNIGWGWDGLLSVVAFFFAFSLLLRCTIGWLVLLVLYGSGKQPVFDAIVSLHPLLFIRFLPRPRNP